MRQFKLLKTREGYALQELPDEQSFSAAPRKPLPASSYTAQELLDFVFLTAWTLSLFLGGPTDKVGKDKPRHVLIWRPLWFVVIMRRIAFTDQEGISTFPQTGSASATWDQ